MKLTLNTKTLATALSKAQSVVESRNTIPILANVLLQVTDDALTIEGTDLDSSLCVTVKDVAVSQAGDTTVNAKMFSDIIRKLPDGDCTVEASDKELVVKAGRSRFKLGVLPSIDWPVLTYQEPVASFEMAGLELKQAFDGLSFAMSQEETRYYLCGIYAHSHEGRLRFVATDGHRLSRSDTVQHDMPLEKGIIIPRKAVIEASKLFADSVTVTVSYSDKSIVFESDGVTLRTKLIDGTFPEYQRVIPQSNTMKMTVTASALKPMIDRVSAVSDGKTRAVKLEWKEGTVTATVSQDQNTASDSVDADTSAGEIKVGVNSRYLVDALSQFDGDVEFAFDDPMTPILLSDGKNEDYLTLIMPMRV